MGVRLLVFPRRKEEWGGAKNAARVVLRLARQTEGGETDVYYVAS